MEMPPEIKEKIVGFLPTNFLVYSRFISWGFNEVNCLYKVRQILYKSGVEYAPLRKQIKLSVTNKSSLEVLRWLNSKTKFSVGDIQFLVNVAAASGKLEVLKWAYFTFNLEKKDLLVNNFEIFIIASRFGNLEVLQWLYSILYLTKERTILKAFRYAATKKANGNLEVLKWLYSTFNFTKKDVMHNNNAVFKYALESRNLEVLKWLQSVLNLTEKVVARYRRALEFVSLSDDLLLYEWLRNTYNIEIYTYKQCVYSHTPLFRSMEI
jgi:hypothetical protein